MQEEGLGRRCRADLVVEGTDVQRRVPRGVLGAGLSPVEEQVLQVLGVTPLAGLGRNGAKQASQPLLTMASVCGPLLKARKPLSHSPSPFSPRSCLGAQAVDFTTHSKAQVSGLFPG